MHTDAAAACLILGLALGIDACWGEYPAILHPVVWMGRTISACLRLAPACGWFRQFFFGAGLTLFIVTLSGGLTWLVLEAVSGHAVFEIGVAVLLLKSSFALRALGAAALRVARPLEADDLPQARQALRALCSRDPSNLDREDLLAAAIESLAENTSDSFIAPLFYYVLFGVPGAVAYRAINTLDAMIGYRGPYEALGKFAARLDDLANLVPARLTALLFLAVGGLCGGNVRHGWRVLRRDAAKTPSPNGGRPMAAMAGLLNVRLDKKGVYSLGDAEEAVTPAKLRQAWHVVRAAGVTAAFLSVLVLALFVPMSEHLPQPFSAHRDTQQRSDPATEHRNGEP